MFLVLIKRSKFYNPPVKMHVPDKRYDGCYHWPSVDNIEAPRACRLEGCKSRSKIMCEKFKTYLCSTKQKKTVFVILTTTKTINQC